MVRRGVSWKDGERGSGPCGSSSLRAGGRVSCGPCEAACKGAHWCIECRSEVRWWEEEREEEGERPAVTLVVVSPFPSAASSPSLPQLRSCHG